MQARIAEQRDRRAVFREITYDTSLDQAQRYSLLSDENVTSNYIKS